jgi:hypothetical protein
MSAQTMQQISQRLQEDLAWRKREMAIFHSHVHHAKIGEGHAILRGAIAMLYAHWEGYVKCAGNIYLNFVIMRRLHYAELSLNFAAFAMWSRDFLNPSIGTRIRPVMDIIDRIQHRFDERARFPKSASLNTHANLSVETFQNIIEVLGLEYRNQYKVAEKPVISRLLELRNGIAHGEAHDLDIPTYDQLHPKVIELLGLYSNDIDNAVQQGQYRCRK